MQPAFDSSNANGRDVEQASNLLNRMQILSLKVRREVARLQVQGTQLTWSDQASRLSGARSDVDTLGRDLVRLDAMKTKLEPWQQNLITRVTPRIHEMVYQMDAALQTLNKRENRMALALSQYPQNINSIYKNANRMAGNIGTVTQYASAEQRMAELENHNHKTNS